jgi:hypothetical protein
MTDAELLSIIGQYEKSALGSSVAAGPSVGGQIKPAGQQMTTLEVDRYNALNAYYGRALGNEIPDRSQVVVPELRDTVEWIMPQLMRMFAAGNPCQFDPENQQDEDQAEIESQTVNFVFMKQNDGFMVLHDFFKDALLLRNGYVNTYWLKEKKTSVENYSGITDIELAMLLQTDDEIEIVEQSEKIEVMASPTGAQQVSTFDVELRRTREVGRVKVECIPPEEMLVSPQARHSLEDAPFIEHSRDVARSELVEMGYSRDEIAGITQARPDWLNLIALARNEVTDQLSDDDPADPASQLVRLRVAYLRVDWDDDGVAELRRVLVAGDRILDNDEVEEMSICYCSPMRMPHRHVGISYYDLLYDLQVIKTTLWRQGLDNLYVSNNQRIAVDYNRANLQDLLTSRPGGIVRINGAPGDAIMPLPTSSGLMNQIIPALEYCDLQREMRTGIGKDTMGVDADSLQDVTKGGQLAAMSAAALKVELVARMLAEGVKDIFGKVHSLLLRHQDKPLSVSLTGRWVDVNPAQWRERTQISINVGLGSGNREEARANLQMLAQMQGQVAQFGLIGPKQAYETFKAGCHLLGYENPSQFAMDPDSQEYQQAMQQRQQQPPSPQMQVAQLKAQTDMQRAQLDARTTQMQTQSQQALENTRLQSQLVQSQAGERRAQLQAQSELLHSVQQGGMDREVQAAQMQSQEFQTVFKALAQIVAQQLKMNPGPDAGQIMNRDVAEVERG